MLMSRFERRPGDRYWTEPWVTRALLVEGGRIVTGPVWEPACGRGDMARVLGEDGGYVLYATDVDTSDWAWAMPLPDEHDFLASDDANVFMAREWGVKSIVTNPPYGARAVRFARACHKLLETDDCPVQAVALLMRADFDCARTRVGLFRDSPYFHGAIRLTRRPRWDDWDKGRPPQASPRHNYSWYLWRRGTELRRLWAWSDGRINQKDEVR